MLPPCKFNTDAKSLVSNRMARRALDGNRCGIVIAIEPRMRKSVALVAYIFVHLFLQPAFANPELDLLSQEREEHDLPFTIVPVGKLPGLTDAVVALSELGTIADPLQVTGGTFESGRPVLKVVAGARQFTLSFSPLMYSENAASRILRNLGFAVPATTIIQNQVVTLRGMTLMQFRRFWNQAPIALGDDEFSVEGNQADSRTIRLRRVLVREVSAPVALNAELLLTLAWLQCPHAHQAGQAGLSDLAMCLGYSRTTPSPNYLFPTWATPHMSGHMALDFIFLHPEMQKAIQSTSADAVGAWLRRVTALKFAQLTDLFRRAGYPDKLSELMASKLVSRRNTMLGLSPILPKENAPPPHSIQDAPQIVIGQVKENYRNFDVDLTRTVALDLFHWIVSSSAETISAVGKHMVENFPFFGLEGDGTLGKWRLGPGMLFRVKRNIEHNPDPKSKDLFVVRDHLEIGATVGVTVDYKIKQTRNFVRAFISAGPGMMMRFELSRPVATRAEAEKSFWMIPVDLPIRRDFSKLQPGETLAMQMGLMAGAVTGLKTKVRIPYTRLASNFMAFAQALDGVQVSRSENGDYVVINGLDLKGSTSARLFYQVRWRLLRLPIAGASAALGNDWQDRYMIPQGEMESLGLFDKLSFWQRLRDRVHSWKNFETYTLFPDREHNRVHGTYGRREAHLKIPKIELRGDRSFAHLTYDGRPIDMYRRKTKHKLDVFGLRSDGCDVRAAVEYVNPDRTNVKDAAIRYTCELEVGEEKILQSGHILSQVAELLGVPVQDLSVAWNWNSAVGKRTMQVEGEVRGELLVPLLAGQANPELLRLVKSLETDLNKDEDSARMLVRHGLSRTMQAASPDARMVEFLSWFAPDGTGNAFRMQFMRRATSVRGEVTVSSNYGDINEDSVRTWSFGSNGDSTVLEWLKAFTRVDGNFMLSEY